MESIATELDQLLEQHFSSVSALTEDKVMYKPSPSKWSKKEILGHLIDSAQNNLRRFIVAQYEENPRITYDQDKWVAIVNYQRFDLPSLVNLWYLVNKQIVHTLRNTSAEMAERKSQTEQLQTIGWLAKDYIKHLRHHLHQVLELEPFEYP